MTGIRLLQVDAFTDRPFGGNPAAVCLLDAPRDDAWMQAVATEMNLSDTAFVRPLDDGYDLRWFTPKFEIALCGHATLASAHVMWSEGAANTDQPIRFHTKSGVLTANRRGELIELDFPGLPPAPADPPPGLREALGASPSFVGNTKFDLFVLVDNEQAVRSLAPDLRALRQMPMRGLIVTSVSDDSRFDFVSRFFAPSTGIDEDPVTGSSHCCLAPFWSKRLGKTEMTGYQASARGGVVRVRLDGDRVILGGQAVTVLAGKLVGF